MQVDVKYKLSREGILAIIPEYQGLIVRSETIVDKDLLEAAVNLRIVGRAGSGLDNIDVPSATQRGITVCNTPESNVVSAAEHTMGLLLSSSRNIPWANSFIKSGQWGRKQFEGSELYAQDPGYHRSGAHRRLGVAASPRLRHEGHRVRPIHPRYPLHEPECGEERDAGGPARRGRLHIHPHSSHQRDPEHDQRRADRPHEAGGAAGQLRQWRTLQRGCTVPRAQRAHQLRGHRHLGEQPQSSHPLYEFENVVGTPHLGASTLEASKRVGQEVVAEVVAGLRGEIVKNAVNIPTLSEESYAKLQVFIRLAEQMGILYRQIRRQASANRDRVRRQGDRRAGGCRCSSRLSRRSCRGACPAATSTSSTRGF